MDMTSKDKIDFVLNKPALKCRTHTFTLHIMGFITTIKGGMHKYYEPRCFLPIHSFKFFLEPPPLRSVFDKWRITGKHYDVSRCTANRIPERTAAFGGPMRSCIPMQKRLEWNKFSHVWHILYFMIPCSPDPWLVCSTWLDEAAPRIPPNPNVIMLISVSVRKITHK
uniref:Uncharacterized protein n=1 Tax=Opuntia streptacantha TaxID=393608 RepID=A0A7C9DUG7_OPUST